MRISLTRAQQESPDGKRLIELSAAAITTGRIEPQAVDLLLAWLQGPHESQVGAITFLTELLQMEETSNRQIVLHQSLERILPAEQRKAAKSARLIAEAQDAAAQQVNTLSERQAEAKRKAHDRLKRRPVLRLDFMISGAKYENRPELIRSFLRVGDTVYLVREPKNPYDSNATGVRVANGTHIGYVPRQDAGAVAALLASGHRQGAYCSAILKAHYGPLPVIQGAIYQPDSSVEDTITEAEMTGSPSESEPITTPLSATPEWAEQGVYLPQFLPVILLIFAALLWFFFHG